MMSNIRKNIEQLKHDERQAGIEQGSKHRAQEIAKTLLVHFDDVTIAQMTDLPIEMIANLRSETLEK